MQRKSMELVGFEQAFLHPKLTRRQNREQYAEVVGSNHPTRSIFINLVKYGIRLSLLWLIVG
jgi:hypothetical protein